MTPDEALRHEWIQSAVRAPSDLRHSQSEASVGGGGGGGPHHPLATAGSGEGGYHLRVHQRYAPRGDKVKAKIIDTRLTDSASLDSNLNDSGAFLPPLL